MHTITGGVNKDTNMGYSCMVENGNIRANISKTLEDGTEIYGIWGINEKEEPATLWFDIDFNFISGEDGILENCCNYCSYCKRLDGFVGTCTKNNTKIDDVYNLTNCNDFSTNNKNAI